MDVAGKTLLIRIVHRSIGSTLVTCTRERAMSSTSSKIFIRGHLQTRKCTLNVIVMLRGGEGGLRRDVKEVE